MSDKEGITNVVYVEKPKAKELKNELEKAHLLNKHYRMIPADASSAPLRVHSMRSEQSPSEDRLAWSSRMS